MAEAKQKWLKEAEIRQAQSHALPTIRLLLRLPYLCRFLAPGRLEKKTSSNLLGKK